MFLDVSSSVQGQIIAGLKQITDAVERWAIPLAAIGSVSMAFIQAVKNLTPIRSEFQRRRLRGWLRASFSDRYNRPREIQSRFQLRGLREWLRASFADRYNRLRKSGKGDPSEKEELEPQRGVEQAAALRDEQKRAPKENQVTVPGVPGTAPRVEDVRVDSARDDLVSLATSGDDGAFYALPIEDLCDQIRKVVSVILDYPKSHECLLYLLARGAKREDIERILNMPESESLPDRTQSVDAEKAAFREYAAAKNRLLVQIRCSVDAIQTSIGYRWKLYLQLSAMILSGLLGVIALNLGSIEANKGSMSRTSTFLLSLLIGLLAGVLAPVARDLIAGIEKWRS